MSAPGPHKSVPLAPWYRPFSARECHIDDPAGARRETDVLITKLRKSDSDWDLADALARRGRLSRRLGDLSASAADFREALSLFTELGDLPSAMSIFAALAEVHFVAGEYSAAADIHRRALTRLPGDTVSLVGLGYVEWHEGHFADALILLTEVLTDAADNVAALTARGQLLADLGRSQAALADLDRVMSAPVAPQDAVDARSARALALADLGHMEEAERQASVALAMEPNRPRTHLRLALIHLRGHAGKRAEESLRAALDGSPALPPAHRRNAERLLERLSSVQAPDR